jgi:hypothetical protein
MHTNGAAVAERTAEKTGYSAELQPDKRKPRDVLRDMMLFYDGQFKDIVADVILKLREEPSKTNVSDIAAMVKAFHEAAKMALDCATKLAPYEHPKLESIEVRKELTHRFVIRAPTVMPDRVEWLAKAKDEQRVLAAQPGHELMLEAAPSVQDAFKRAISLDIKSSVGYDPLDPLDDDDDDESEDDL